MTKVKCPDDCVIEPENLRTNGVIVDKEIDFITGETSTRNYCCRCGKELEEVDYGFRMIRFDKEMLPQIFKERNVAMEIKKGLPKDAELADTDITEDEIHFYFKSSEWNQTNLDESVEEIVLEVKDHDLEELEGVEE